MAKITAIGGAVSGSRLISLCFCRGSALRCVSPLVAAATRGVAGGGFNLAMARPHACTAVATRQGQRHVLGGRVGGMGARSMCSDVAPPDGAAQMDPRLFEVDEQGFVSAVIESKEPVVVFVCADWCKEQVATVAQAVMQAKEGIKLALMASEKCPSIIQQLKVDSVPTCLTFMGGKMVDRTSGAMSLEVAQQYVAKMMELSVSRGASQIMINAGKLLGEGKLEEALHAYMSVLQMSKAKHGAAATAGMTLCALNMEDLEAAKGLVKTIKSDFPKDLDDPIVKQAVHAVEFAEMGAGSSGAEIEELEGKISRDANDHQARHDLSLALFGKQRYAEAFKHALDIVKIDKAWEGGKGKELLFKFFETLGNSHPEVLAARKRMATLLF